MGVCECIVTCVGLLVGGMVLIVLIMCITDKGQEYIKKEKEKQEEKTEEEILTEKTERYNNFFKKIK